LEVPPDLDIEGTEREEDTTIGGAFGLDVLQSGRIGLVVTLINRGEDGESLDTHLTCICRSIESQYVD